MLSVLETGSDLTFGALAPRKLQQQNKAKIRDMHDEARA